MEVVVELGVPGASDGVGGPEGGRLIRVGALGVILLYAVYLQVWVQYIMWWSWLYCSW